MSGGGEIIIRNGTLKELLFYYDVKIGGKAYRAWQVFAAFGLVTFIAGALAF